TDHEWLPHQLVDLVTGPFAHPFIDGIFFQPLPVVGQFQKETDQTKAYFPDPPTQTREQDRSRDGIKRIEFSLVVHDRVWSPEDDLIRPAQLCDQTQHMSIAGEPVVVKLLNRPIPVWIFKPGSQT